MAKTAELTEEQLKYTKYKWEFLRRNPKYANEWEELIAELKSKYGEMRAKEAWSLPRSFMLKHHSHDPFFELTTEELAFCLRWNILMALNPSWSYEDYIVDDISDRTPYWMFRCLIPLLDVPIRYLVRTEDEHTEFMKSGKVNIEIDINFSEKRLKEEFDSVIKELKKVYQEREPFWGQYRKKTKATYRRKHHWDNYDLYVRVYDFNLEGKSYSEIANELNLNSWHTARNHYRRARSLVEEGIELYGK